LLNIFNIESQDYGLPFALPGKGIVLRCKNIAEEGNVTVLKGELIHSVLEQGNLNNVNNLKELPFRMFYNTQNYSQTLNPIFNNYEQEWSSSMSCLLNLPGVSSNFIDNLQFINKFDLRPFNASNDEMVFNVYFFPYYIGDYIAKLKITWKNNVVNQDQYTTLIIKGSMINNISEIDQTQYHELVFEVDQTSSNNFFEIY